MTERARRRVCVVISARPSYSRIKTALEAIRAHPDLELQVVVTASALLERYGKVADTIARDGFAIAAKVHSVIEGEDLVSMPKSTAVGLLELPTVFDRLAPDVAVTVADRYETIATAIAAAYTNLPLAHVQGGEVTGSIDEKVRHAVTKLADLHLVATAKAAERVVRMGEDPATVFVCGCPSIDLAARVRETGGAGLDFDPIERYGGVGPRLELDGGYLVVLQHPVTTAYRAARDHAFETLYAVREIGMPTLWFWPNVDAGSDGTSNALRTFRELEAPENIHFFKNMAPEDFLRLLDGASCLVGNSSAGIRECSFLGVPVVDVGDRQAGRERGANAVAADHRRAAIAAAIRAQIAHGRYPGEAIYGDGRAGEAIAARLAEEPLRVEKRLAY